MKNIIIVDDHALFREGIKLLIENEGLGKVIGEAENGKQFLDLLKQTTPDLVIMDIEMPIMNGLEATKEALKIIPDLKILVLTMLNEKANYLDMVNAGALGFVLKTSGKAEFEKGINAVVNGESYISNQMLRRIIENMDEVKASKQNFAISQLTLREMETLNLLCKGLSINEIAESLFLSPKTVESHRSTLLKKTETKNTINLVLFAIKNKLVVLD